MNIHYDAHKHLLRHQILVQGQVQGVGFRPFVYRLAYQYGLTGHVRNTAQGVIIEVQGSLQKLQDFALALPKELPPLAELSHMSVSLSTILPEENAFTIIHSQQTQEQGHSVLISPDVSLCAQCETDMADTENRRHLYAFTNCTNCGPRYTITKSIPYDRATTSMACFPLCPQCQKEYDDPMDRRFHAQPNACPTCGPQMWYIDTAATSEHCVLAPDSKQEPLESLSHALLSGKIAAIKGLGGFHLACYAADEAAIARLRMHKNRPHKPFAVMVADMASAKAIAHINSEEERLLVSRERPIVLCRHKEILPSTLAPDTDALGIMLPYTPLHSVLFTYLERIHKAQEKHTPLALVMTSGNAGGEPICLGNRESLHRLRNIAEVFLLHNRDILVRTDDSVCALQKVTATTQQAVYFRRARGFVPRALVLQNIKSKTLPTVIGMGAELKNTLCLTRKNTAFVSQHIGDLQNLETLSFYEEVLAHMEMLLQVKPHCLVHDLHPDFLSTGTAQTIAEQRNIACIALQHHYAHAYAVLAEHNLQSPCLALSLDGTGLGEDGTIWGGELLYINNTQHTRLGRLSPFALVGGEQAIREPWRIAVALAHNSPHEAQLRERYAMSAPVLEMLTKNIRSPLCSSAGRLFDGVAAALGLCDVTSYEGQAAIRLEQIQKNISHAAHFIENLECHIPHKQQDMWELSSHKLFNRALHDAQYTNAATAAYNFHHNLAEGFSRMASLAAQQQQVSHIALCGGVMQNATLYTMLYKKLTAQGLTVLTPQHMPCNDGAISLGQAYYGLLKIMQ